MITTAADGVEMKKVAKEKEEQSSSRTSDYTNEIKVVLFFLDQTSLCYNQKKIKRKRKNGAHLIERRTSAKSHHLYNRMN